MVLERLCAKLNKKFILYLNIVELTSKRHHEKSTICNQLQQTQISTYSSNIGIFRYNRVLDRHNLVMYIVQTIDNFLVWSKTRYLKNT